MRGGLAKSVSDVYVRGVDVFYYVYVECVVEVLVFYGDVFYCYWCCGCCDWIVVVDVECVGLVFDET